jgi:hypothetical protein
MRFRRGSTQTNSNDDHLTYFTVDQANQFRALVRASFAHAGRDVTVYPDHVDDRSGTTFGLWNIGALCAGLDPDDWSDLIHDHVRLVTTPTRALSDLSAEEFDAALFLRLVDAATVPDPASLGHAREFVPGLLEVLSVDLPDSLPTPPPEELAAHGVLSELVERGRANLRALLTGNEVAAETVGSRSSGRFTAVTGDSYFTASLALLLPEVVERFSGDTDRGRGALVAVPFRHQLLYRVIDARDATLSLHSMFEQARRGFHDEPGPLSPNVYWVRNHRWVQVTSAERGKPKVLLGGGFGDALNVTE